MRLCSVSACAEYLDDTQTKMKLEEGFDFDIAISEQQAKMLGVKDAKGESHLCIRVLFTGEIEGIMCECPSADEDISFVQAVSDDYMSNVIEIISQYRVMDMATATTRAELIDVISNVSKKQGDKDIILAYGDNYDKYLEAYDSCLLSVYRYGIRMIEKYMDVEVNFDKKYLWQICVAETADITYRNAAKLMQKEYNIRDEYIAELTPEQIEEKIKAISPAGIKEGQAAVRKMSGRAVMSIYYERFSARDKNMPQNLMHKISERLEKNSK